MAVTFIRIPKNASTSLYHFFGESNTARNEYLSADNPRHLNIFESSHQTIAELEMNLGSEILDNPVLAVVRNPYERLVSMYFFAKKYDLGKIYDVSLNSFQEFARGFYTLSGDRDFFHATPQVDFIYHPKMDSFTIIRFEYLKQGLASFVSKNGLRFDAEKIEKLNSTEHEDYMTYYDAETIDIVNRMWGKDLAFFSYFYE